jgi:hypothetical protein
MDETPTTDADCDYRAFACELTQWLFEGSSVHPASVDEFLAAAMQIEHYITEGGTIEFHCTDALRKCVRGGI